jgi:hypothetical protein
MITCNFRNINKRLSLVQTNWLNWWTLKSIKFTLTKVKGCPTGDGICYQRNVSTPSEPYANVLAALHAEVWCVKTPYNLVGGYQCFRPVHVVHPTLPSCLFHEILLFNSWWINIIGYSWLSIQQTINILWHVNALLGYAAVERGERGYATRL